MLATFKASSLKYDEVVPKLIRLCSYSQHDRLMKVLKTTRYYSYTRVSSITIVLFFNSLL